MKLRIVALAALLVGVLAACPPRGGKGPEISGCRTPDDCSRGEPGIAGSFCVSGSCVGCRGDSDCVDGQACTEGRCVVGAACACTDGEVCEDDVCVADEPEIVFEEIEEPEIIEVAEEISMISDDCRPGEEMSLSPVILEGVKFELDDWTLSPLARASLDANAVCLNQVPELTLVIEGHADERGTTEYNLALGDKRAQVVRDYLVFMGVDGDRLSVVSKGEDQPLCVDTGEDCWSENRRVVLQPIQSGGEAQASYETP